MENVDQPRPDASNKRARSPEHTELGALTSIDPALSESEEQFRSAFEQAAIGIALIGNDYKWLRVNQKLCDMLGYTPEELMARDFPDITHPDDVNIGRAQVQQLLAGEIQTYTVELRNIRKDRAIIWIRLTVSLVRKPTGDPKYFISFLEDITHRRQLENQLLQAQKLESVGRLAGGVAHDFNNLLTAILGYAELAEDRCRQDPTVCEYLQTVQHAAQRAAELTRQLLAFARRQHIEPRTINLNELILGLDKMMRRLIGEDIELVCLLEESVDCVRVDPGQFEQILINLVVNARDAMPDGGKITIETSNALLDEEYAQQHDGVTPGDYVVLAVSDNGTGMEEGIRLHIFEPFFTTKEKGRGTGLGLATVYGIVKQAGGHIWLYSEPGQGTTFRIYLPKSDEAPEARIVLHAPEHRTGSETVLLVEDEPAVRALAVHALRARGYRVIEAMNGEEALRAMRGRETEIALLVTDVVMPQMNGKELADRMQAIHPGLKVLYASGYTENTIVHHGVLEPGVAFLSKPFTPAGLTRRVREVLDGDIPGNR
jgi:PAS domain S-box-containing protein